MDQSNTFWLTTSTTDGGRVTTNLSDVSTQQAKDSDITAILNQPTLMNFASIFANASAAVASSSTSSDPNSTQTVPSLNQIRIPPASNLSKRSTEMITQQIIPVTHINQISIQPTQIMTSAVPSINNVPIKTTIYTLPLPVDPNEVSKNFIQQAAAASGLTASSTAVNILNNTNIMVTQQRLNNGNINRVNPVTPLAPITTNLQISTQAVPTTVLTAPQAPPSGGTFQCDECNKLFANAGQLRYHTFVSHAELQARPHKCLECPESFLFDHHLRDHMRAIHLPPDQGGGPPFTCSECLAVFNDGGDLNFHLYMMHTIQGAKQQHPCLECGKSFIKPSLLSAHIRNVHDGQLVSYTVVAGNPGNDTANKNFKCTECGKQFKTVAYLKQHTMSVHDKPLKCSLCVKGFGRKSDLKRHMRGVHMRERPHSCTKCGWTFAEVGNLKHHMQAVHSKEKNFRCMYCEKTFALSSYLRTHLVRMHNVVMDNNKDGEIQGNNNTVNQMIVGLATSDAPTLQTVQFAVAQTHVNRCFECGQTFQNAQLLQTHVMSTHSQPFWCTVCGEGFSLAQQLQVHLQLRHSAGSPNSIAPGVETVELQSQTNHVIMDMNQTIPSQPNTTTITIQQQNKCPSCGNIYDTVPEKHICPWKKFQQQQNAVCEAAIAIVTDRPHLCTECGKSFKTTTHLKQHVRCVHTKDRPYKCTHCEKSFARTSDLNRHIKGVHQRQKPTRNSTFMALKCTECGAIYAESPQLKRHIYTQHLRGRPSYKCADCQEGFQDEASFQTHICHEEERPHVCSFCSKRFTESTQLRRHLRAAHGRNHEEPQVHKCFQCNRHFGRSVDLERHIQAVHLKEKPHKCPLCGKCFGLQGNLNKHVRAVHYQEKPHQCIECGKRFAHVGVLKRHLRDIHFYDKKASVKQKLAQMQSQHRNLMQSISNEQDENQQPVNQPNTIMISQQNTTLPGVVTQPHSINPPQTPTTPQQPLQPQIPQNM